MSPVALVSSANLQERARQSANDLPACRARHDRRHAFFELGRARGFPTRNSLPDSRLPNSSGGGRAGQWRGGPSSGRTVEKSYDFNCSRRGLGGYGMKFQLSGAEDSDRIKYTDAV